LVVKTLVSILLFFTTNQSIRCYSKLSIQQQSRRSKFFESSNWYNFASFFFQQIKALQNFLKDLIGRKKNFFLTNQGVYIFFESYWLEKNYFLKNKALFRHLNQCCLDHKTRETLVMY